MNVEVFAKGLEKSRLLTNLLGRNVENLDDYGCPKNSRSCQNGQFVDLLQLPFPTQNKAPLCREKSKGVSRMLCNICKFCTCLLYFCLLLI